MAIVKFSKKEFEKHIRLTKQIEEKISMFGTPLESVTKNEITIEVFPNRPDLLSLEGYIRGFLAFLGKKHGLKQYQLNKPIKNYEVNKELVVIGWLRFRLPTHNYAGAQPLSSSGRE